MPARAPVTRTTGAWVLAVVMTFPGEVSGG
jgi:hypothetical protein